MSSSEDRTKPAPPPDAEPSLNLDVTKNPVPDHGWPESIKLDRPESGVPWSKRIDWSKLWPVPAIGATYGIHRYYRHYRPRKLPVLTPLRLPELYIALTVSAFLYIDKLTKFQEVVYDNDLLTIHIAGWAAREWACHEDHLQQLFRRTDEKMDDETKTTILSVLRNADYDSSGAWGKLKWYNYHMWSDRFNWVGWSFCTLSEESHTLRLKGAQADFGIFITHLANSSTNWNEVCKKAVTFACGIFVPLGLLARWSGRRSLILPVNGIQRLLVGAYIWTDLAYDHAYWNNILKIRHKHEFALLAKGLFKHDRLVESVRRDLPERGW